MPDAPISPYFVNWSHHRDHLGTSRTVMGEAGYVTVGYDDHPYAARMPQSPDSTVGGSMRQDPGHERNAATGLVYMMARSYGDSTGSFLSVDPSTPMLSDPASWNRYIYAHTNALLFVDPDGRAALVADMTAGTVTLSLRLQWPKCDPTVVAAGFGVNRSSNPGVVVEMRRERSVGPAGSSPAPAEAVPAG
jgi:RHS repeat-associated protein